MNSVFYFQAEDGIRDGHVTGVQTCALPIFTLQDREMENIEVDELFTEEMVLIRHKDVSLRKDTKIGRASCRERVENWGEAGAVQRAQERKRQKGATRPKD